MRTLNWCFFLPRTRDWPYSVNCQFGSVSSVYNWATRVDSLTPSITRLLTHPPHFLPTFLTTTYWCIWYVVRAVCHLLNVQANLMGIDSRKMDGGSKKRSHHIWFHATPDLSSAATSAPSTIAPGQRRACACVIQVDPSRSKLGKHCDWSCHEIHCKGSKQCTKAEVCKGSSHGVDNKGRSSQKGHSFNCSENKHHFTMHKDIIQKKDGKRCVPTKDHVQPFNPLTKNALNFHWMHRITKTLFPTHTHFNAACAELSRVVFDVRLNLLLCFVCLVESHNVIRSNDTSHWGTS